jgi:putative MFS transporter
MDNCTTNAAKLHDVKIPWRIERLPSSKHLMFITAILGLAFFFEFVDNGTITYFLPVFAKEFNLSKDVLGMVGAVSNIGVMVGALLSGLISDMIGRKKVIIASMALWGVFGVAQSYAVTLNFLIVTRLFLGLGIGAQLPATITLLSELMPSKLRAKYLVSVICLAPLGSTAAGILCYFLIPTSLGWRGVAVAESIPALVALLVWKYVTESPIWLEAKGRRVEADAIMTKTEQQVEKSINSQLPPVVIPVGEESSNNSAKSGGKTLLESLFSKKYLKTNIMISIWWPATMIAAYGLNTWFSMIFVERGISITKSIGYVSIMSLGGVLGVFIMPWMLGRFGRKISCVAIGLFAAIFAFAYGSVSLIPLIVFFGVMFNLGSQGVAQVSVTYASELYPTSIRNTGVGYAQFIGRVGSVLGPVILGFIIKGFGVQSAVYFAALMYVIGGIFVILFGTETKGKIFTEE